MPDEQQPIAADVTPEAETPPAKVVFDDLQKLRVQELINDAVRRAGSSARQEVTRLKALQAAEPQNNTDVLLRLAESESQLATLRAESAEAQITAVLHKAVASQPFFDGGEIASQILRSSIRLIEGKPCVVNADGSVRLGSDFSPMQPAELVKELADSKKFLIRSTFTGGTGSVASSGRAEPAIKLSDLFGPTSSGAACERLLRSDRRAYNAARAEAVRTGLLRS